MKRAILFFAFLIGIALSADAQCSKSTSTAAASCCSKGKTSTSSADAGQTIGADIEQRTNAAGEVSYVRKMVHAETGAVSYKAVEYCTKTNQFVDAGSAADEVKDKAGCADGAEKAGCCSGGAKTGVAPPAKGKGARSKA